VQTSNDPVGRPPVTPPGRSRRLRAEKAVLFDLCGVLLAIPDTDDRVAIERAAGLSGTAFWDAYWAEREAYDTGLAGTEYWQRVSDRLGRPIPDVSAVIEADVASSARPDQGMITLVKDLMKRPVRLGLLSNITPDLLRRVEREQAWVGGFDAVTWSCDYRVAKPDPRAFTVAQRHLDMPFEDILFVDDNASNIAAAAALGMQTHLFHGRAELEPVLRDHYETSTELT
jgi:putative hydrolase of the HAD superfamily